MRGDKRAIHHSGAIPGFRAHIARFPDEKLGFIVLDNASPSRPDEILWRVAAKWLPGVEQAPANGKTSMQPGQR